MTGQAEHRPEFSRLVTAETIGERPLVKDLEATSEERVALAARFGLKSVHSLKASLRMHLDRKLSAIRVRGRFEAEVVQTCVVTLAPVPARLVETVDLLYSLSDKVSGVLGASPVDVDLDDPTETIGPDGLELGEAIAQQLAVALDPYPRARDADVAALEWSRQEGSDAAESPFAPLKQLRGDG